jgi:hypothetical protein
MATPVLFRAFVVWLVIIAAETVHGVVRELILSPLMGHQRAKQIGVPVGSLIVLVVAWFFVRWIGARTTRQLLCIGLLWVVLTVLFEIGLGRLVLGLPWDRITEDYDVHRGGYLGFGLAFMALSPLLVARLQVRNTGESIGSPGST